MKIRKSNEKGEKIEPKMAPMIDIVFLLLIFFMLTLKITEQEGDFNINMPIGTVKPATEPPPPIKIQPLKVRLRGNPGGQLVSLEFNGNNLGNGSRAYQLLNQEVLSALGGRADNPLKKDMEVEIEADAGLHYEYVINAVSACNGKMEIINGQPVLQRYIDNIKFAPAVEAGS